MKIARDVSISDKSFITRDACAENIAQKMQNKSIESATHSFIFTACNSMQAVSLSFLFSSIILTFAFIACPFLLPLSRLSVPHKKPRNSTWLSWVFTFTRFLTEVQWASSSRCIQGASTADRKRSCGTTHFRSPATADYRPWAIDYGPRYLLPRRSWSNSNFLHSASRALRLRYQLRWQRECDKQISLTSKRFERSIDITCCAASDD